MKKTLGIACLFLFFSGTATAENVDPKALKNSGEYNEYGTKYPVPGYRNLPWSVDSNKLKKQKTARYKAFMKWADAHGIEATGDDAKQHPGYSYTTTLGPGAPLEAKNIWGGSFSFKPGATYGLGSHAAYEVYIITSGTAIFYNYDREVIAGPGTWVYTRPFDVHGIKNASETESVEMNWIWWREDTNRPNWDTGGIPFQPKETWLGKGLHPDMKPTKQPADLQDDDRFIYMYSSGK